MLEYHREAETRLGETAGDVPQPGGEMLSSSATGWSDARRGARGSAPGTWTPPSACA